MANEVTYSLDEVRAFVENLGEVIDRINGYAVSTDLRQRGFSKHFNWRTPIDILGGSELMARLTDPILTLQISEQLLALMEEKG